MPSRFSCARLFATPGTVASGLLFCLLCWQVGSLPLVPPGQALHSGEVQSQRPQEEGRRRSTREGISVSTTCCSEAGKAQGEWTPGKRDNQGTGLGLCQPRAPGPSGADRPSGIPARGHGSQAQRPCPALWGWSPPEASPEGGVPGSRIPGEADFPPGD